MTVKVVILTNIVSPHVMPLARRFVDLLGVQHVRYIAEEGMHLERAELGWEANCNHEWVMYPRSSPQERAMSDAYCRDAPILLCGLRRADIFESRARVGLHSYYFSERWFKPPLGAWRVLHPGYLRMAIRLVRLMRAGSLTYLPIGVYAARDMMRIMNLLSGLPGRFFLPTELYLNFAAPMAGIAMKRFGRVGVSEQTSGQEEVAWMRLWGYFVELSDAQTDLARTLRETTEGKPLRVLWLGRMLAWKHGETLVQAALRLLNAGLPVQVIALGRGPEEARWRKLAGRHAINDRVLTLTEEGQVNDSAPGIYFQPPVPIAEVRRWLRAVDVLALTSNGGEGWGAVVSEAMAEGVCVVASRQAGSSATLIEDGVTGLLFDAGDVEELAHRLLACQSSQRGKFAAAGKAAYEDRWAPDYAARKFLQHSTLAANGAARRRVDEIGR